MTQVTRTIYINKYYVIFVLIAIVAVFVKLYLNNCLGTCVQLEYQTTKDHDLSSVVVECRAHCQGNSLAGVKIDVGECTSNPVLVMDNLEVDERKLRSTTFAKASIPCFLRLSDSVIPGANKGMFTDVFLNKGVLFGPYTGFIKGENSDVSWYTWKIDTTVPGQNASAFYMDGDDEIFSNWLRWVNAARCEMKILMFNLSRLWAYEAHNMVV
uniref:SET domain-containing protein n=1 Tax=Romanomermis culicivorax TaxID=13658 RepID=A0A915ILS8_ROMCU